MTRPVTTVVTGYMRSGTSMLMACLQAGGLEATYDEERDEYLNRNLADPFYQPNEEYFEIGRGFDTHERFPIDYEGTLIKVLTRDRRDRSILLQLYPLRYHILLLVRDPREILESYTALEVNMGEVYADQMRTNVSTASMTARCNLARYRETMRLTQAIMSVRKDVESLVTFDYRCLIRNPHRHFALLADFGWRINPMEAAKKVDPARYRKRVEDLPHPGTYESMECACL